MNLYRGGNILVISRRVIQVDEKAEKEGLPCRGKKKMARTVSILCLAGGKEIILLDIKFRDKRGMGNQLER